MILHTGVTILRESSADLMDLMPGERVSARIRQLIDAVSGVEQVEEVHVHRIGLYLMVNVTIGIDGSLSVAAGDEIANRVEFTLRKNVEYLHRVSIHYHPSKKRRVDGQDAT